jgi:CelD/BcsL family acetyltransferase involved in cellulose biosynthesis
MSHLTLRIKREKLSRCQALWDRLFDKTSNSSPFVSFEWFDCLSRLLLHKDPDIVLVYEEDTCVGIIPVYICDNTVRFISDERVTDVTGCIYQDGYENEIAREIASLTTHEGLHVDLYPLDQTNPMVQRLANTLHNVTVEKADVNPLLELPASWDDYCALLTAKLRHELRRKLRKGNAIRLEPSTSDAVECLFKLMVQDAHKRQFLTPDMRAFFTEITKRFFSRGWLRLRCASIEDTHVAALFAFSCRGSIYLYNMGINVQYESLSPGIVAIALDIHDAITEGKRYYNFLRGDEEYKFRFGARKQYTVRLRT